MSLKSHLSDVCDSDCFLSNMFVLSVS